ncbi:alpha-L-fucosidase [Halosquirtibacter xylanolyticus]|uniref:alpha-L-fucosidase n=1 Tax=Halosquirtibacter xylanolyticus TaxID=3374599 RepID=UPI003749B273|nr:alpha-L-fucosidase [Prolixibacteraceae bacterium]
MKRIIIALVLISQSVSLWASDKSNKDQIVYNTSDESLHQYNCPEWFRDAKFGIFLHWGVASHMGVCGWYSKWMYWQDASMAKKIPDWADGTYDYHLKHHGHPSKVGFKDLCPLWKADRWEPNELVTLFKKAGAKYVVPLANHHDNFDNWDSSSQPWNSVNMGPKRDIIGDWGKAIRAQGLYFGVSSHAGRCWKHNQRAYASDQEGPMKGVPYDGNLTKEDGKGKWWEGYDPADLYCPKLKPGQKSPDTLFLKKWYLRTTELYDKYNVDLLYFDGLGYQLGETYRRVVAEFYNTSMKKNNGSCEAVVTIKRAKDRKAVVDDFEKGVAKDLRPYPWQTDTPLSTWYYSKNNTDIKKPAYVIVDMLIDIVSKNGNLLLNVAMKGDGSLDENQRQELIKIGKWLDINGEAIYSTRPWKIYGEGPTNAQEGHYKEFTKNDKGYLSEDIRFTTHDKNLYAIAMDVDEKGDYLIKSLGKSNEYLDGKIKKISLLGYNGKVKWKQTSSGLRIHTKEVPNSYALAFKITIE